ncbi:MAG: hypothetical protein A2091_04045 [Desulfuromonadales bacterium GWD2_61_12]|nr:MAG: hypothetical protein A2005_01590 [Desulfuromonadales bacterium GWC2_61_20]OGR34367.1 MAG: hypothetical protein A2091_04045 [Desulfuromonadales bacterium GWD2_61_12]
MPPRTDDMLLDLEKLRQQQVALARQVRLVALARPPATVAGVDAAMAGERIVAVAVLYDFVTLTPLEAACVIEPPPLPYIPGFLAFREGPALAAAVRRLTRRPDLLIVDGQGIAHPRRCGLACHLGVELGLPALGCAKSRLIGRYAEPAAERGAHTPLMHLDATIGAVVRTRNGVKPVFVSPGHLLTLDDAIALVLRTTAGFRLPEPQRAADRHAAACKRRLLAEADV